MRKDYLIFISYLLLPINIHNIILYDLIRSKGPVEKFFSCMYGKNPVAMGERPELKAIRLWSDWNAGLKKWAMKKVETVRFSV